MLQMYPMLSKKNNTWFGLVPITQVNEMYLKYSTSIDIYYHVRTRCAALENVRQTVKPNKSQLVVNTCFLTYQHIFKINASHALLFFQT